MSRKILDIRTTALAVVTSAALLGLVAMPLSILASQPSYSASLTTDKATVDAAKANGLVGEQGDGFLGFVNGAADPTTAAAVAEINAGRADVYRQTAAKTGVTPEAAGQATGALLLAKVPSGQYYKPLGGGWTKK
jgi:uncharacterized protein YdbL (DUF1318 family)